jgi:hypothetical protein
MSTAKVKTFINNKKIIHMPQRKVFVNIAVYSPKRRRLALVKSALQEGRYGFLRVQLKRGTTVDKFAKKLALNRFMVAPINMIKLDMFIKKRFLVEHFYLVVSNDYIPHYAIINEQKKSGGMIFLAVKNRLMNKNVEYEADNIVDNVGLYELVKRASIPGWKKGQITLALHAIEELKELGVDEDTLKKMKKNIPYDLGVTATCAFSFWHRAYCYLKQTHDARYNPILIQ